MSTTLRTSDSDPPVRGLTGGDRLIVREDTGHEDDFMIVEGGGQPKVKRVVQKLEVQTGSPGLSATSRAVHDLADVNAETEKRALAIYTKFAK
ncbi:MAG TPA: hypothetical protein VMI10_02505 [Terriglobales bacterium]|nr:hypothetical protein [Terriglobales bacterium]